MSPAEVDHHPDPPSRTQPLTADTTIAAGSREPRLDDRRRPRITSIHTVLLDIPLIRPHRVAVTSIEHQSVLVVRLRTSDGVEGIGEAVVPGGPWWGGESIEGVQSLIERYMTPLLLGRDASSVQHLAQLLDEAFSGARFAKAALEMALWDARGKALNVPLYELFGGLSRQEIAVTWAIGAVPAEAVLAEIEDKLASSAHASFKLKMGAEAPDTDVARITAVADRLAGRTSLRVDLNGAWDELTATRWLPHLQQAGIEVIEQPLPAWNIAGAAALSDRLTVAIMADESLLTPQDAARLIRGRAADLFSVKVAKSGGLAAVQRIAGIAQTAGIACHGGTTIETSVGTAASAHLFCALPAVTAGSELFGPLLLGDDIVDTPVHYQAGFLRPPAGPGLGVTLDETKIAKYARV